MLSEGIWYLLLFISREQYFITTHQIVIVIFPQSGGRSETVIRCCLCAVYVFYFYSKLSQTTPACMQKILPHCCKMCSVYCLCSTFPISALNRTRVINFPFLERHRGGSSFSCFCLSYRLALTWWPRMICSTHYHYYLSKCLWSGVGWCKTKPPSVSFKTLYIFFLSPAVKNLI